MEDGMKMKAGKLKANGLLSHTKPALVSEATAVGSIGILINPGSTSFLFFDDRLEDVDPDGSAMLANALKIQGFVRAASI
jgi:hypothetical protein